jgi:hypothetical protein
MTAIFMVFACLVSMACLLVILWPLMGVWAIIAAWLGSNVIALALVIALQEGENTL